MLKSKRAAQDAAKSGDRAVEHEGHSNRGDGVAHLLHHLEEELAQARVRIVERRHCTRGIQGRVSTRGVGQARGWGRGHGHEAGGPA